MGKLIIASVMSLLVFVLANKDLELFNAASEGNLALVNQALASGANPNWQHPGGSWPMSFALIWASANGYAEIVSALLNGGADPNLRESRNNTALMSAAYFGHLDLVPILIYHGADVNLKGSGGKTALAKAINSYHPTLDMVRLLLNNGVDPNQKDRQGRTAAAFAREVGYISMANFIDNFDTNSVTVAPTVSTTKLSSPTTLPVTTTTDSTIKFSSQTTSPVTTSTDYTAKWNNLPLPIQITLACLVVVSMGVLIYLVVLSIKRFRCHQQKPRFVLI